MPRSIRKKFRPMEFEDGFLLAEESSLFMPRYIYIHIDIFPSWGHRSLLSSLVISSCLFSLLSSPLLSSPQISLSFLPSCLRRPSTPLPSTPLFCAPVRSSPLLSYLLPLSCCFSSFFLSFFLCYSFLCSSESRPFFLSLCRSFSILF